MAKSVVKLRKEVGFYLSFMDEEVFQGVDLPEEEGDKPSAPTTTATDTLGTITAVETLPTQKATPAYTRWDTVLHPSQPVMAAGEVPQPTAVPWVKRRVLQPTRTIPFSPPPKTPKPSSPPRCPPPAKALALVRPPTLPHGFAGVAAYLRTLELMEVDRDTPASAVTLGMVSNPGMSSICSSQVVRDDEKGLVYLYTVTTSIGWMVIGSTVQRRPNYWGRDRPAVRTLKNLPLGGRSLPHCNPNWTPAVGWTLTDINIPNNHH